jgi:uncharacterized protein (DUF1015 family)
MCIVNPFPALRPAPDKVAEVATHSVERYSKEEIERQLIHNPVSFLHVINPESTGGHATQTEEHLRSVRNKLQEFVSKKIFIRDESPCLYIYRQVKNSRHHLGIIGLASVDDYNNKRIKIHEQTLAQREEKLKEYLDICEFNAEPVCLTYPHNRELNEMMQVKTKEIPLYDYIVDGISHAIWIVNNPGEIELIQSIFKNIPAIYVADGHHRAASSARLAEKRKAANPRHTGKEAYNFFTAALFADDELTIFSYNRIVNSLNGHTADSFLNELRKKFEVSIQVEHVNRNTEHNVLSLYTEKKWYTIRLNKVNQQSADPASTLDVSILSDHILAPLLGIKDLRNDKRISFLPGIKTKQEIEKIIDSGKAAAAFCLHPVSFDELIAVANSGKEMPPKSTWIEPKLESGLLIYSLA